MGEPSRVVSSQEVYTKTREIDIPRWLSLLVLISVSLSLFLALGLNSNPYLTSRTGFADGGDMYSHQVEALYLKELLQSGTTDLWFDEVTLGYPFFLAYHPFPCLFTSSLMMLTESFISPLLLFRWMFTLLLSSMPWFWFIGLRKLKMTRLEATVAALCVHSIHSWRKFGLELDAFQEYGIFTQAYGMAVFPLAVGFLYQYVLFDSGSRNGTVLLIVLNFTSHAFFGIYLGIATGVTLIVDLFTDPLPLKRKRLSPSISRALCVHFFSVGLLSWWIIPLLSNFNYIGGLPWKNESEHGYSFEFVLRNLLSGEMFDHGRKLPFITLGVLAGVSCTFSTHLKTDENENWTERQTLFLWLRALFLVTLYLFLGRTFSGPLYDLIPFHKELEVLRYLNGIHFCGLLFMAVSFSRILRFFCKTFCRISKSFFKSSYILIIIMLILPPIYLSSQLQVINSRLSMTEINNYPEGLEVLKAYPNKGRVLASKALGE